MEAFKSLKAYQYFADGLVTNVWTHHLQREDSSLVVVKGYCFTSLKARMTYTVRVVHCWQSLYMCSWVGRDMRPRSCSADIS